MRRDHNGRTLEFQYNADGGALLVQNEDPARQSVYLTSREMRWLAWAAPLALVHSFWLRDHRWERLGREVSCADRDDMSEEEECAFCGRSLGPDSFDDDLRCKFCQEEDGE